MQEKVWCIIPAAGIGARMKSDRPKQYLMLGSQSVLERTMAVFFAIKEISGGVVGIARGDQWYLSLGLDKIKEFRATEGGAERAYTVLNCINFLKHTSGALGSDWVLVHDAVRPCVSVDDIRKLISTCLDNKCGGLLGCELVDTIKRVDNHGRVEGTESRNELWRAMTPQLFPLGALQEALQSAVDCNQESTDESYAMEMSGVKPLLVHCASSNIKITRPEDLEYAKWILGI